jgi:2-keto-3-deoxy-6-phosphogluconate aldolase
MILGAGSIVDEPTAVLHIAQGAEIIKLFPALAAGGPDFIRQILGPSSTGPPPMT